MVLRHLMIASALFAAIALAGCSGGSSASASANVAAKTPSGKALTADDRAAADFVLAKLQEHWLKGPDGWTSRFQLRNMFGEVLPGEPDVLFRQLRDIKFAIEPEAVSESQKLNGTDYRAGVSFEKTSERFYRTVETFEGPAGWSLWEDEFPSFMMAVERRNGKWLISDDDLFSGIRPEVADVPTGK